MVGASQVNDGRIMNLQEDLESLCDKWKDRRPYETDGQIADVRAVLARHVPDGLGELIAWLEERVSGLHAQDLLTTARVTAFQEALDKAKDIRRKT
jgi:CelD/BcsL family acetyltransferase involved in cellulose biosynthesis